ncbi:hypothetical protein H0E87_028691 [Populus deltoides]|uniref:Uncharacterized protein n=1 Tax=Populus deltoides TaxID=3696 RepID=A0A8T2WTT8_POPDE|nr:hypothetical protein H0E87_028691 [Populus deltoides]
MEEIEQARASRFGKDIDVESQSDYRTSFAIVQKLQSKILESLTSQQDRGLCCIYKVPYSIRNIKPEAYTPQLISIGPIHHGINSGLEGMEKQKVIYYKEFTERHKMDEEKIGNLVRRIQKKEEDSNDDRGPKTLEPWMIFEIREDLMLLENQLPFFVIREIYDEVNSARQESKSIYLLDVAAIHFGKYTFSKENKTDPSFEKISHFTDLLRQFMLCGANTRRFDFNHPIKLKYSAVMLREAGVKFQATEDKCLVNITFKKGVLKIPPLEVAYSFERLVRNIMALEQCHKPFEAHICNDIKFMDQLIDSAEDVELLVKSKIILHRLGDDATFSDMINKLCEKVGDTYTCYDDICKEMNAHYENPWNSIIATLHLVYFPNVWRGTGTFAAAVLLILTFMQTVKAFL